MICAVGRVGEVGEGSRVSGKTDKSLSNARSGVGKLKEHRPLALRARVSLVREERSVHFTNRIPSLLLLDQENSRWIAQARTAQRQSALRAMFRTQEGKDRSSCKGRFCRYGTFLRESSLFMVLRPVSEKPACTGDNRRLLAPGVLRVCPLP